MKRMMKLENIVIRESFANTIPRQNKMKECRDYWNKNQKQDRYIVVDRNNVLVDGYIQYLVLKENGVEEVEIRIGKTKKANRWRRIVNEDSWDAPEYREKPTTYITCVHVNSITNKEYMWRVPSKWIEIAENLQIGDVVYCRNKHKMTTPVIITKIEVLDRCPVDYPISKMCRKIIKRDGVVIKF